MQCSWEHNKQPKQITHRHYGSAPTIDTDMLEPESGMAEPGCVMLEYCVLQWCVAFFYFFFMFQFQGKYILWWDDGCFNFEAKMYWILSDLYK